MLLGSRFCKYWATVIFLVEGIRHFFKEVTADAQRLLFATLIRKLLSFGLGSIAMQNWELFNEDY